MGSPIKQKDYDKEDHETDLGHIRHNILSVGQPDAKISMARHTVQYIYTNHGMDRWFNGFRR